MSVTAVKAGEAYVEAFLEKSRILRDMKSMEGAFKAWGTKLTGVGTAIMGAGLAITAPLIGAIKVYSDVGSAILDVSLRTGMATDSLYRLGFMARQSGSNIQDVEAGVRKMQRTIHDAAGGMQTAAEALGELGLNAADLQGMTPDQQFETLARALAKVEDPTTRAALAMEIFGKSGTKLLPVFADFDGLNNRAKRLGLTMSTETAMAAHAVGDAWEDLKSIGTDLTINIGAVVAPAFQKVTEYMVAAVKGARDWIQQNKGLVTIAAGAGVALVGLGGSILSAGIMLRLMAPAIGLVHGAITGLIQVAAAIGPAIASSLAIATSPLGLTLAAVTALGVGFYTMTDTGKTAMSDLAGSFEILKNDAMTAFDGIKAAMEAGDFQAAGEVLWAALEVVWASGTASVQQIWADVVEVMTVAWNNAAATMGAIWDDLQGRFQSGQDTIATWVAAAGEATGIFVEGTSDTLKEDQAFRSQQRQADFKRRAAEREKSLQTDNMAAFESNNKKRAELEANLAAKRDALQKKSEEAKKKAEAALAVNTAKASTVTTEDDVIAEIQNKLSTRGTFSAAVASQIGGQSESAAERSARSLNKIETNTKDAAENTKDVEKAIKKGKTAFAP